MGDYVPLSAGRDEVQVRREEGRRDRGARIGSLDVFRGLSIALMIFVDYAGSASPFVAHVPWNGVHLADFVMPFFLIIVGISVSIWYKVDMYGYKFPTFVFDWMGRHSLSIFILVASNIFVIVLQGFYWRNPKNNIVHWIVTLALHR